MKRSSGLYLLFAVMLVAGLLPLSVTAQPPVWVQLSLGLNCPDWTRIDMEYYAPTGLAYIMGGRSGTSTVGTIYAYDPVAHACTDTGQTMPVPISNYTIVTVNNGTADLLCTFGGRDSTGLYTTAVQCFDPVANTVSQASALPGDLGSFIPGGAAAVNNIAYVFSGFRNTVSPYHSVQTWAWEAVANTWAQVGNVGLGRGYIDVAVVDGKIYAFGGDVFDGTNLVAQTFAEVLDPATGTWDDAGVADLPTASGEGRAYGFDGASGYEFAGTIVIAGGGQWPSEWNEVVIYDVASQTYDYAFPNLNVQRRNHAGFFVPGNPGRMFVYGGRTSADGYGGDNPPYAPPEYYEVAQAGPCEPPTAVGFSWNPADPFAGEPVTFIATAQGSLPRTYDWDFGDGNTGTGSPVTHAYAAAGDYLVVLTVTNECGTAQAEDTLTVLPTQPDIFVSPASLAATQCPDTVAPQALSICNEGNADLTWSLSEAPGIPWLSEDPSSGTLPPGECQDVTVTFDSAGLAPGDYFGDLAVDSNDPDEPQVDVPVQMTVVDCQPDIVVSPASLSATQCPDTVTPRALSICNEGNADLTWSLSEAPGIPWLSEDPSSGTLPPGECQDVMVLFDSTGLAPGDYFGELLIGSNDPDEPQVNVPVQMTVVVCDDELHLNRTKIYRHTSAPWWVKVVSQLQVYDQDGLPVAGAAIEGEWTLPDGSVLPATPSWVVTDSLGRNKFQLRDVQFGEYRFCVTDMTALGYEPWPAGGYPGDPSPCLSITILP